MGAKIGCLWPELFRELVGYCHPEMGSKNSDFKGDDLGFHLAGRIRLRIFFPSFFFFSFIH